MKLRVVIGVLMVETILAVGASACATAETLPEGEGAGGAGADAGVATGGGSGGTSNTGGGSNKGGSAGTNNGGTAGAGGATGGSGGASGGSGGATGGSGGATGGAGGAGSGGATGGSGGATGGSGGATGGSGGGVGGTGGGSACQIGTGEAVCDNCINSKCETECVTCQNNSECLALLDCIGKCQAGDSACQATCNAQHSSGTSDAIAFFGNQTGCVKLNCDAQCGGGGGTLPTGCYTAGTPVCNPLTNSGCASGEACDISSGGLKCYPGPNTAGEGETCGAGIADCIAMLTCSPYGECTKICCDDSDCTGSMVCVPFNQPKWGTLGGCL
ncbi:MAG: hypothetical protein HY898_25390 [Deltaproteobacteria bacterium]|nr:hypothetical protein [Deltaproteobacteria bacterium]